MKKGVYKVYTTEYFVGHAETRSEIVVADSEKDAESRGGGLYNSSGVWGEPTVEVEVILSNGSPEEEKVAKFKTSEEIDISKVKEKDIKEALLAAKEEVAKAQAKAKVREAYDNSRELIPEYLHKTAMQRLPECGAGSVFDNPTMFVNESSENRANDLLDNLFGNDLNWEERTHPDVLPGCKAYVASAPELEGRNGIIDIDNLPDETEFVALDYKDTGKVSIGVESVPGERTDEVWVIIGEEQGKDVIFTFHPGEPVRPSEVEVGKVCEHGDVLTKEQVKALGFDKAKIVADGTIEQIKTAIKESYMEKTAQLDYANSDKYQEDSLFKDDFKPINKDALEADIRRMSEKHGFELPKSMSKEARENTAQNKNAETDVGNDFGR